MHLSQNADTVSRSKTALISKQTEKCTAISTSGENKYEVVETHKEQNFEITGLIP